MTTDYSLIIRQAMPRHSLTRYVGIIVAVIFANLTLYSGCSRFHRFLLQGATPNQ